MSQTLQAIRGMNDILPAEAELWEQFEDMIRDSVSYTHLTLPTKA